MSEEKRFYPARHLGGFTVGCDIGQAVDPTAVCILERLVEQEPQPFDGTTPAQRVTYACRHLQWLPLRMSYPSITETIAQMMHRPPLSGKAALVIDATGVGKPIADFFRRAGLKPISVVITAGDGESRSADTWRVSKLMLVSRLSAELHSGNLKISKALPEAMILAKELADFRVSHSAVGYQSFGAREGAHDDLVLALAISLWHAARPSQQARTMRVVGGY